MRIICFDSQLQGNLKDCSMIKFDYFAYWTEMPLFG